jgi:hypothetical protein
MANAPQDEEEEFEASKSWFNFASGHPQVVSIMMEEFFHNLPVLGPML